MREQISAATFEPTPAAVGRARRFLRESLRGALDEGGDGPAAIDFVDLVVMAVNELTTNAVQHGRTEFTVTVIDDEDCLRVEVDDGNTRLPQPCMVPPEATSGRGLTILDGSGLQWGIRRHAQGKTVWVRAAWSRSGLDLPGRAERGAGRAYRTPAGSDPGEPAG